MKSDGNCPNCHKPVPADTPMGLCPECLVRAGFPTGTSTEPAPGAAPRFVAPALEEMGQLFPQLEIQSLVGCGGMGAVYQARQKQLNRVVALKVLPRAIGSEPAFAERFAREARALAQLNHPGIVAIYEYGEAQGLPYFIMELVDGVNLRQLLATRRLSPREALALVPQICDALQFAHDHGVVHRDIKPENILVDRQGRVKVADFGLAKLTGQSEPQPEGETGTFAASFTAAGNVMGTPNYMSPEQLEHPSDVDHRADIYALGVVLYQMLTGELPKSPLQPPSRKVELDVRLDEIVLHALEKEPSRRYQQARALKTDVETLTSPAAAPVPAAATLSGLAVAGACLVPFFFISMIYWDFGSSGGTQALLGVMTTALGWIAVVATTVLGWLALRQIRRAAGRVYGLGLAMADALVLPLLCFDVFLVFLVLMANKLLNIYFLAKWYPQLRESAVINSWHLLACLSVAAALVVIADIACVRLVWRWAAAPLNGPPAPTLETPRPALSTASWKSWMAVAALLFTYLGTLLAVSHYHGRSNYIGTADFQSGNWVTVSQVERNSEKLLVRGSYRLITADEAQLRLSVTPPDGTEEDATELPAGTTVPRGQGQYLLVKSAPGPGYPHVDMASTNGDILAWLYFGTKKESIEERRLGLAVR